MTGSEWVELSEMAASNMIAFFAVSLTLASAYLIMSYSIGSKLSKFEIVLANLIFAPAMFLLAFGNYTELSLSILASQEAAKLVAELSPMNDLLIPVIIGINTFFNLGIIIVCFVYIRNIRRRREI